MKIGMIGIGSTPSQAKFSHNAGWTYALISMIKSDFDTNDVTVVKNGNAIHQFDAIVINEGLNYKSGTFNFFGGMQPDALVRLENLAKYKGKVYCYNENIDWNSLAKRKEIREQNHIKIEDLPAVILLETYDHNRIIIGDSHTVSVYEPGWGIDRNDGATLYGALRDGGLLKAYKTDGLDSVQLYLGNIDIRFHLMRQPKPHDALIELCGRYNEYVLSLLDKDINVTVHGLLPVEEIERKLPGTGLYKGEPFFGTRRERQQLVNRFNTYMRQYADDYDYEFSGWELPMDGFEDPKFFCMEARQSVHLRPEYYKHIKQLENE